MPRVVGFCLLARRDAIDRVGGLDERFGPGNFEDDDLCLRIQASGYGARIALDSFVHHEGSRTFATAKVDWTRAMIRNWTVFKELWGLPADAPLEGGYEIRPERLAPPARYVPLPALGGYARAPRTGASTARTRSASRSSTASRPSPPTRRPRCATPSPRPRAGATSHRRYHTRRRLVQAVFDSGTTDPALLAAAAGGLVAALEDNPREPVLLNELGVLFYELRDGAVGRAALPRGASGSTRRCPRSTRTSRPRASWRRCRARSADRQTGLLRTLAARAEAIAARAVPYTTMRISLCMIVKDEEEMLPRCLAAVAEHVDEIVIVDTGSTDRTVEIAESFGANVIEFPWNGSFADARNVSLDTATGDWILWLDADEVLDEGQGELLRELAGTLVARGLLPAR